MKATWTVKEKSNGVLSISLEGDVWAKAQAKALKKLAEKTEIKGFRKGKAPIDQVKKSVGERELWLNAVEEVAQDALEFGMKETNALPISRPELGVEQLSAEAATLTFTYDVKPEVTLGQYKDLGIKKEKVRVTKKEVDAKVEELRHQFAELVLKETGKVEDKDTAVIDFEGFKGDVAFEGGKGENYSLEIGSNSFIPGFEEAVIGMETGETKDIPLTFPESYHAADLAGQEVVFKVKVNEIKTKQLPDVNDDFAKTVNHHNTETMKDLLEHLEAHLREDKEAEAEEKFTNEVLTKVVEGSSLEVPQSLINDETDRMVEDFAARLKQQGFSMEQFSQITGQTEAQLREQMTPDAAGKVKVRLVLDAIAQQENLSASDEEVEAEYTKIATDYNLEMTRVKELLDRDTVVYDLRLRKAFDLIKGE
jgi:trigger factor